MLNFYNTRTRQKEAFIPLDSSSVGVYACGPTVYDRIHVGNARPVVVFDVLVRLLRHHFGQVTYVRNITDIDDKINARAAAQNIPIGVLTKDTTAAFHADCAALGAAEPDIEPRATDHIDAMLVMIKTLVDKGHAYVAEGHVLFDVSSLDSYGSLSRCNLDEMIAGARVEPAPFKHAAADFILWKPSSGSQPGWDSPWGFGRPGWHIECSAMSGKYLGTVFDIHAGGMDLIFPHHENEIAQSCAAHGEPLMAKVWLHNGYVTIGGEKMSKSLGNFTTVADVLKTYSGEAVRYALLSAHYRAPLDFSMAGVGEAKAALDSLYRAIANVTATADASLDEKLLAALGDDLNTPNALARLHELSHAANKGDGHAAATLKKSARLLGLLQSDARLWFQASVGDNVSDDSKAIEKAIATRLAAKASKDYAESDRIRDDLLAQGIVLEDTPSGTTWRRIGR